MLPLILSVLILSSARGDIANPLSCSGFVIDFDDGEHGYPAGVCWSWSEDESVILKCNEDDGEVTVIEYPNDNCNSDSGWDISYPTNGCTDSATWDDDMTCTSYCPSSSTPVSDGCPYFFVKYYESECNSDGSPKTSADAATDYWTRPVIIGYCYPSFALNYHSDDDHPANYTKFENVNGKIKYSYYTEETCQDSNKKGNVYEFETSCNATGSGKSRYVSAPNTAESNDLTVTEEEIPGRACVVTGDPHFITFNGQYHHTQGVDGEQYYYIAPCIGYNKNQLPFEILGTHGEWTSGSRVTGVEDITIILYDVDSNTQYSLFVSPSHLAYIEGITYGTKYDDNDGYFTEISTNTISIGSKFTLSRDDELYTITIKNENDCDDGEGELKFKFEGRTLTILPPSACYRRYICGLCGDFDPADGRLKTCKGTAIEISATPNDEEFWKDPKAFDTGGLGWSTDGYCDERRRRRRLQIGGEIVYTPTLPENFTITNPCDSDIEPLTTTSCQTARNNAAECCDILGTVFCDSLQKDCNIDACVSAGNDANSVDQYVKESFTDAINSVCTIPGIETIFDDENLNPTDKEETDAINMYSMLYSIIISILFCFI